MAKWKMRHASYYDGVDVEEGSFIWELNPPTLPEALRTEYRIMRAEGASPKAARYHVSRMLDMLSNHGMWTAWNDDDENWTEGIEDG